MPALRPKQQAFVEQYLVDLNATQAAIRAGYSPKTAHVIGSENLAKPEVAAAVAAAQAARSARVGLTADDVLRELALVGRSNVWDYRMSDTGELALAEGAEPAVARAVSSIKRKRRVIPRGPDLEPVVEYDTEFRLWSKTDALRMAGEHVGLFEKNGTTVNVNGGAIQVIIIGGREIRV